MASGCVPQLHVGTSFPPDIEGGGLDSHSGIPVPAGVILGHTNSLPLSTSQIMAPTLANKFCKLQTPHHHHPVPQRLPEAITSHPVTTPLCLDAWEHALSSHPDRRWVSYILQGLCHGFRIGLECQPSCRSSVGNSPSASKLAPAIEAFLWKQCQAGCMLGPFPPEECGGVITSSLGVIPKKTPGKFRVIVDLSRPEGHSVNDSVRRQYTHLAYSSVEDATLLMHALGPGTLLAKVDIRDAYRLLLIHPEDRPFLGIKWQGGCYVDCQLPFGLASAPAIFSAVADALEWILRQRGVRCVLHYLDDFLLLGSPQSDECLQSLAITMATCRELGVPLAEDKTEGPYTELSFLSISLDSERMAVSLPPDKLQFARDIVQQVVGQRVVRDIRRLESLVGHLVHATKVCPLGKAFLSSLFTVSSGMRAV